MGLKSSKFICFSYKSSLFERKENHRRPPLKKKRTLEDFYHIWNSLIEPFETKNRFLPIPLVFRFRCVHVYQLIVLKLSCVMKSHRNLMSMAFYFYMFFLSLYFHNRVSKGPRILELYIWWSIQSLYSFWALGVVWMLY